MRKLLISTLATLLIATGYATPSFADSIPDYPGISKLTRGVENSAVKKVQQALITLGYPIPVANGTVAIELIIKAIGIKNREIILPSNTFFATIVAVENSGNIPILVDIENDSFSVCPNDLRKKISTNTAALILVHIGGIISSKIEEIIQICSENNIELIEDAAHAHLSSYRKQKAGTLGIAGAFSFFPTKVMTTGEGGMITTNSEVLYQKIKSLKNFGRDNNNAGIIINDSGNNFKINEFTGLLGYLECQRVEKRVKKRNNLIQLYRKELLNTESKETTEKQNLVFSSR